MLKVKKPKEIEKKDITSEVKSLYKFKNARMIRVVGNFMGGGFNVSQNKVKAILENIEVMRKFANGEFDENIDELQEDEVLEL